MLIMWAFCYKSVGSSRRLEEKCSGFSSGGIRYRWLPPNTMFRSGGDNYVDLLLMTSLWRSPSLSLYLVYRVVMARTEV